MIPFALKEQALGMQAGVVADQPTSTFAGAVGKPVAARGNYWEVTYRPSSSPLPDWKLSKSALQNDTGKTAVLVTTDGGQRAVNLKNKKFEACDINHFELADSSFSGCEFVDCRFIKAHFREVKFSKCKFERCHFLMARFTKCQFIGCDFSAISASAEHVEFVDTSLSAQALLAALSTNLEHLPSQVDRRLQEHRFLAARTKIARAVFLSVRNEPELDQLFDATQCFEMALQRQRIAEATWTIDSSGRLKKQPWASRVFVRIARVVTLAMLRAAGFLTDWGQSPAKSVWILVLAVPVFSVTYWKLLEQPFGGALLRALDSTFVFGYTRYAVANGSPSWLDWLTFANALVGFSWYALLIPALSKRIFR